jgi:hypothetical protein
MLLKAGRKQRHMDITCVWGETWCAHKTNLTKYQQEVTKEACVLYVWKIGYVSGVCCGWQWWVFTHKNSLIDWTCRMLIERFQANLSDKDAYLWARILDNPSNNLIIIFNIFLKMTFLKQRKYYINQKYLF